VLVQKKKAGQKSRHVTMESRINFEKTNTAVGIKRFRQPQIKELVDFEAISLDDRKVARYICCTNYSFIS